MADLDAFDDLGKLEMALAQRDALMRALESIAGWRKVNLSGEYEHGLRDIIRSITDCAAAALDAVRVGGVDK